MEQTDGFAKAMESLKPWSSQTTRQPDEAWKKPPMGVIKVNWDASIDKEGKRMGMGVVARDHEGEVVATLCAQIRYITDPTSAEALAAWKGVELINRMEWNRAILEGDAQEVVKAFNYDGMWMGSYGAVIQEAKEALNNLQEWQVQFVKRTANSVAHRLAKFALELDEEQVWTENVFMMLSLLSKEFLINAIFDISQKKKKKKKRKRSEVIYLLAQY
jgi:ribonuclease HI